MARTETAASLELGRSMDMQIRVMTFGEHLQHMEMIDKLDDNRRKEQQGAVIWHNSMQRSFFKRIRAAIGDINDPITRDTLSIIKNVMEVLGQWEEFHHEYHSKLRNIQEREEIYEEKDDKVRKFLITYAEQCRERLSLENRAIEERMILENVIRKMAKK